MERVLSSIVLVLFVLSLLPISQIVYVAHAQTPANIVITQDNITASPYFQGGSGTAEDPWILSFGTLDLAGGRIWLTNFTSGYIVIKDSEVYNAGDYLIDVYKNVSGIHLTIENCKLHGITGTGPVVYISADNSVITIKNSELYNASSNTWWDAVLTIRYADNTIVNINSSKLYLGGHIIRVNNANNVTLRVYGSELYGITDHAGSGTDWRGLIRLDGYANDLKVYIEDVVVSGKDADGPASFIEVETTPSLVYVTNATVKNEGAGLKYGVYVKSGGISDLEIIGATVEEGAIQDCFIAIYSNETMSRLEVSQATVAGLGRDFLHIGSEAEGIHIGTIGLYDIKLYDVRYFLGFSPRVDISAIFVGNVECERITKVMSIPNSDNKIGLFYVDTLNVFNASDGFDIRGISRGYFANINLTYFNPDNDAWIDGNGFYLVNVNNTVFENVFFYGAGWKEIILDDGYFENITIVNFVSKEYPGCNGRNPLIAIGPWGTAHVENLLIENGTVYDEDLVVEYDHSDVVENLIISNVKVYGSAPAGWEGGRCGRTIYLTRATNVTVLNSLFEDAEVYGVYLNDTANVAIAYTNISHSIDYGIYIEEPAANVIVMNSTFWYNGKSPQAYSDSPSVVAIYNYYSDHTAKDLDGDGIADEPYEWAGSGGVVDLYPLYTGTYLYYLNITDENAASLAISGNGTAENPYVIPINITSIPSSYKYGVYVNVSSAYVVITGLINGTPNEAAVYISPHSSGHVRIENMTIGGSGKHGLIIDSASGITVEHLTIRGSLGGWAIGIWKASDIVLAHIYIDMKSTGWDGVYIDTVNNLRIDGIRVFNPKYKGIYIRDSNYVKILNARIDFTGDDAIQVYNVTHLTIKSSFLGNAKWHDLKVVSGSYITIIDTVFNGIVAGGDGVVFGAGGEVYNVYMENIVIRRAEWKGLWFYNTVNATIVNAVIDGEGVWFRHPGLGIEGSGKDNMNTHDVVIKNCVIKGVASNGEGWESGIFLKYAKDVVIEGCEIAFNTRYGIEVFVSENIVIKDNNVYNNSGTNIILFGSAYVVIENNNITGAKDGYGVGIFWNGDNKVYSHNIVIKGNMIMYNSRSGIKIQRGNIENVTGGQENILITHNVIAYNGYGNLTVETSYGIIVEEGASNITITWNDFIDNHHKPQAYILSNVILDRNYWSDYTGTDTNMDGYGDQPYITDGIGVVDPHPRLFKLGEICTVTTTVTTTETTTVINTTTITTTETTTETITETTTETETVTHTTVSPSPTTTTVTQTDWTLTSIIAIILLIIGLLAGFFAGRRG